MVKIQGRAHKERSQPKSRGKLGFLEKHKDYVKRAKNYHQKQDHLKKLHAAAAFKNPDEFKYGMINTKTDEKGLHLKTEVKVDKKEAVANNSRSAAYLRMQLAIDTKNSERLSSGIAMLEESVGKNKRILFADNETERKQLLQERSKIKKNPLATVSTCSTTDKLALNAAASKAQGHLKARVERKEKIAGLLEYLKKDNLIKTGAAKQKVSKDGTTRLVMRSGRKK
eukprot:NODE_1603_length_828_cov_115.934531_g1244_i0.p1 GENE.NODE_1603_length_828_cov_115.934531_g1244_i0~~NODE_1603_length_828_cov_115.934531_g1244_i0.p1  ORF type:complete len:226 (-),score=58.41 NODE_1603_length_828_cov_115.934531_g1244_i0:76-753(-)